MSNLSKKLAAILFGVLFALVLLEIACQALFAIMVAPQLKAQQNDAFHYYKANEDPLLSYSLQPGYSMEKDGRRIHINRYGVRADNDSIYPSAEVALFGDSVPFGIALSQEETPPAALQRLAGDSLHILNFGTPGYGLEELLPHLKSKFDIYKPQLVYYFLNINDFSRRNTIYEGGDNGLYRIYQRPFLKLPFFIRKAVYRFIKEGKMSSVAWYRWMYEGNKDLLDKVTAMNEYVKSNGSEFRVVLFPAAVAYENGTFALQDIFDEIGAFCREKGIPVIAPVNEFSQKVYELQDNTDHFTPQGSEVIARVIWQDMQD